MPTNQLAPPDMPWLTGNVASPPNPLGPPLLNYAAPPSDRTQGAGVAAAGQQAWQWLQDQRAESVRQGLLDPNTGLPTQAGLVAAAGQTAQGVMMGTTGERASPLDNPAFAKWFGNSHVADEAGQPLTVYKGMYPYDWTQETPTARGPEIESINRTTEFPAFNKGEPGTNIAGFFSDDPAVASRFAGASNEGAVYPVHLSFQNPHVIDAAGEKAGNIQFGESGQAFRDAIRSGDHDSVIIKNTADEGNIYIALRPEQIKSAIGNRGTYDPNDPRMNYGIAAAAAGTQQQQPSQ